MVIALPDAMDRASHAAALAELERLTTQTLAPAGNELTVGSTLRGDHHTVVMVGGRQQVRRSRSLPRCDARQSGGARSHRTRRSS